MQWHNITYPQFPLVWALPLWKRVFCGRGWHLFDEVYGACSHNTRAACECAQCNGYQHALYCDACGLTVPIKEGACL
jgi:hypothetical protein